MNFDWGQLARYPKWIYVLGGLGILFLLFGSFYPPESGGTPQPSETARVTNSDRMSMGEYEKYYETKLSEILNEIQGVTNVTVMVNLDSTEEVVYAENIQNQNQTTAETDNKGGNRTITQINENKQLVLIKGGTADHPIIIRTIKPRVRGVLVVAKGAEQPRIQALITDAVQRVLEVPPHRISIQPKKM